MDQIDASELIRLGEKLTATRDEVHQMGHQLNELLVSVRILTRSTSSKKQNFIFQCEFDQRPCGLEMFRTFAHDRYGLCLGDFQ